MLILLLALVCGTASASPGDRSSFYQACLNHCVSINCSDHESLLNFMTRQTWYLRLFQWDCDGECQYQCMWRTVRFQLLRNQSITQFHGKWPFIRIFGMQEPASALFSLLNAISHFVMWRRFKESVPTYAPNFWLWKLQVFLSVNAFFWSTLFHIRETPATEKLDYFCAFSLVLCALYSLLIRVLSTSNTSIWLPVTVAIPFIAYFIYHIHFLMFDYFDYGYNMKINVFVGVTNSLGWLLWCLYHRRNSHVPKCVKSILLINGLLLLELWDFPPLAFILDAHALWHFGTIPLPIIWYRFLIEDSWHLIESSKLESASIHKIDKNSISSETSASNAKWKAV